MLSLQCVLDRRAPGHASISQQTTSLATPLSQFLSHLLVLSVVYTEVHSETICAELSLT